MACPGLPSSPPNVGACSGRGACVAVSGNVTGMVARFPALCACDEGYTGAGDFYDARVAVDPNTGRALALDCVLPVVVSQVAYGVVAVVVFARWVATAVAIGIKLNRSWVKARAAAPNHHHVAPPNEHEAPMGARLRRAARHARKHPMLGLLLVDFLVAMPCMAASVALRFASNQERVFGTDPAFTALWFVGLLAQTVVWNVSSYRSAMSLIKSRAMSAAISRQLSWRVAQFPLIALFGYVVFVGAFPLGMLGLDKSRGPIDNGQYIVVIVRGLGMGGTHVAAAIHSVLVLREARALLGQLAPPAERGLQKKDSKSGIVAGGTSSDDAAAAAGKASAPLEDTTTAATRVLTFLEKTTREFTVSAVVGLVLVMLTSVVPLFWPWQCVSLAAGSVLLQWKSSVAVDVLRAHRAQYRVRRRTTASPRHGPGAGAVAVAAGPSSPSKGSKESKNNGSRNDAAVATAAATLTSPTATGTVGGGGGGGGGRGSFSGA